MTCCDSLCLYRPGSPHWSVALLGHEGMILVRETGLLQICIDAGFNVSIDAPEWW